MTSDAIKQSSLTSLAQRLQADPRFMAYALAVYQQQEELDVSELAAALGALPEMLTRLALCQRPDAHSPQFAEQVRELADYTLIDEAQLANLLRQVSSLEKLAQHQSTRAVAGAETEAPLLDAGLLAAARDRDEADEHQPAAKPQTKSEE